MDLFFHLSQMHSQRMISYGMRRHLPEESWDCDVELPKILHIRLTLIMPKYEGLPWSVASTGLLDDSGGPLRTDHRDKATGWLQKTVVLGMN